MRNPGQDVRINRYEASYRNSTALGPSAVMHAGIDLSQALLRTVLLLLLVIYAPSQTITKQGYLIFADHEGEEPATITKVDAWLNPA